MTDRTPVALLAACTRVVGRELGAASAVHSGWLNVWKPAGLPARTLSNVVQSLLRRSCAAVGQRPAPKLGHVGTLDPMAQGLLPMAVGPCTRAISLLPDGKTYLGRIKFGLSTSSDDVTGDVIADSAVLGMSACSARADASYASALQRHIASTTEQVPPAVTALQVRGQRMYALAQPHINSVEQRAVLISSVAVHGWCDATDPVLPPLQYSRSGPPWPGLPRRHSRVQADDASACNLNAERPLQVSFLAAPPRGSVTANQLQHELALNACGYPEALVTVRCASGVYIRALARDAGVALPQCPPSTLSSLTRVAASGFSCSPSPLAYDALRMEALQGHILPADAAFMHLPAVALCHDQHAPSVKASAMRAVPALPQSLKLTPMASLPCASSAELLQLLRHWNDDSQRVLPVAWIEQAHVRVEDVCVSPAAISRARCSVRVYVRVHSAVLATLADGVAYRDVPVCSSSGLGACTVLFMGLATLLQATPSDAAGPKAHVRRLCTLLETAVVKQAV